MPTIAAAAAASSDSRTDSASRLLQRHDTNADGALSFDEYIGSHASDQSDLLSQLRREDAFDQIDTNGDGGLTAAELRAFRHNQLADGSQAALLSLQEAFGEGTLASAILPHAPIGATEAPATATTAIGPTAHHVTSAGDPSLPSTLMRVFPEAGRAFDYSDGSGAFITSIDLSSLNLPSQSELEALFASVQVSTPTKAAAMASYLASLKEKVGKTA